jgi:hypothetical protein
MLKNEALAQFFSHTFRYFLRPNKQLSSLSYYDLVNQVCHLDWKTSEKKENGRGQGTLVGFILTRTCI